MKRRKGNKKLATAIVKNASDLASLSQQMGTVTILDQDPVSPKIGQMWLLRVVGLFFDSFTGVNSDPLSSNWEVTNGIKTGYSGTKASTNKIDIQSNKAQINIASGTTISDAGKVDIKARMKKIKVDWTSQNRIIKWKCEPYNTLSTLGIALNSTIVTEGGNVISAYTLRVINDTTKCYLQAIANASLTVNQNFLHGKTINQVSEFTLEIGANSTFIKLYQDDVLKLTIDSPTLSSTSAWLYLFAETSSTDVKTARFDDVYID